MATRKNSDGADPQSRGPTRDAFTELYEAYADQVYRYLRARVPTPQDAEELTSRTFLNALTSLENYRGRGSFVSWLMSIAHNLLANWYRDRGRRPPTAPLDEALQIVADAPEPLRRLQEREEGQRVRQAIAQLSADRQQLIALKYVEGRTNSEIGEVMQRPEGAIKALHHRTLRQLREALGTAAAHGA